MCEAIRILTKNDVYHGHMINDNREDCALWHAAMDAKHPPPGTSPYPFDWDSLLGNYAGVTDFPAAHFWQELMDAYPEAKVVLVQRDYDNWLKSWGIIVDVFCDWRSQLMAYSFPQTTIGMMVSLNYRLAYVRGATNKQEVYAGARDFYDGHYADIRRECPSERLLNYKIGSGWEPLCEFLGKPVPDCPFPRMNDAEAMNTKIDDMRGDTYKKTMRRFTVLASAALSIGATAFWSKPGGFNLRALSWA
jgi:hypothetical protein